MRLGLLYAFDEILGFDLANDLPERLAGRHIYARSGTADGKPHVHGGVLADESVPEPVIALAVERAQARNQRAFARADELRRELLALGYAMRDGRDCARLIPAREEERFISASSDVPSQLESPDRHDFSIALLAHNNRADLERAIVSVAEHAEVAASSW